MKTLLFITAILSPLSLFASNASDALQAKLNAMNNMSAHFKQRVQAKERKISTSTGKMALQRPGRFLWHTLKPLEQVIVADGQKLWVYDVDLEQVTVKKQDKGLSGSAALFISGYNKDVANDFDVQERQAGSYTYFDLKAKKSKENFQRITMGFVQNNLMKLDLYDQLGQKTSVVFDDIVMNKGIAAKVFSFTPPKGVDVVTQ
jgi:outer membrane lipoprotein carrier protein